MRIKNNVSVGSIENWLAMAILFTLVLLVWFWLMSILFTSVGGENFFSWFFNAYKFASSFAEIFVLYIIPIAWLCFIIVSIYVRHKKMVKFNKKLDLEYVDFLPDRVKFSFNQPQCNFTCGYKDIEKLEMRLEHIATRTKTWYRYGLDDIKLSFTVLNKKHFSLTNRSTRRNLKAIYAIIDAGRLVKKFSYKIGSGYYQEMKERIEAYQKYGLQILLTSEMKGYFEAFSIWFFAGGLAYWCYLLFTSEVNSGFVPIFSLPIIALVISFVADIFLILDRVNEKKHKGF